jgi:tetratricopeptide (TPR) repeat protein
MLRECLSIYESTLPDPHVQTAWALNDLAIVLNHRAQYAEAERLYRQALAIFERVSLDRSYAANSWHGLGEALYLRGQTGEAEKYYRNALELRKQTLGAGHVSVAQSEAALGRLLSEHGSAEEAERLLRDALEIYGKTLPRTHWRFGYTQTLLGNRLMLDGRFREAERFLLDGYEALRVRQSERHTERDAAASYLVALYAAWGKPDEASKWRLKERAASWNTRRPAP